MQYLKSALTLRTLIQQTNVLFLKNRDLIRKEPNRMRIMGEDNSLDEILMGEFSNEFLKKTLSERKDTQAFVFTDIAVMEVKGHQKTYILYKGYHSDLEKGMVFYQLIDKETLSPQGELQFSNLEENIFYIPDEPLLEESSCNAMETNKKIENGKSIVFFIGHMDETRLLYDIERLIIDTVHNVAKHSGLQFHFILHIARYGAEPSSKFRESVKAIDDYTSSSICSEYPNTAFEFTFEQDES